VEDRSGTRFILVDNRAVGVQSSAMAVGGDLVCAGTLTPFGGAPANIGVLTAPAYRNQGFGVAM
jgi:hypothetical protein